MAGSTELETRLIDAPATPQVRTVHLVVISGHDRGLKRRLGQGTLRVGTAPTSDIRLTDPTISRVHCVFDIGPHGIRVLDSGSTNGTFVNGMRVHDVEVTSGTVVSLGATILRLELGDEVVPLELSSGESFGQVIGKSVEMRRIYAVLEKVAPTDATILIQGETGTGKDAVARAVHEASKRAEGPFVAVDCGAIAENIIESELFGHVRGAFSGAVGDRKGLFEAAQGGTLFLDEIGDLPLSLQPKLLRALESREIRRVGENAARRIDVRLLAATNRPLARSVNVGEFREDLYYRLAVLEVHIPPLRARRDDIPLLAAHFYKALTERDEGIPPDFVSSLVARAWPGNVRELRNYMERSVALGWTARAADAEPAGPPPAVLGALVPADRPLKEAREVWTAQLERLYVDALLRRTGGHVTRAAEIAGVNRRSIQRLMAQHGIRAAAYGGIDTGTDDPDDDE